MNNYLRKGISGALFTLLLAVGATFATSGTAQAQYRQYPDNRDWQYRRDNRDHEREERIERERRAERYRRNNTYGYPGVYNRGGSYGGYGNYGYGNNAYRYEQSQGYQAGLNTGASDAQRGQSFNPQRSHYYRDASSQAFREGFLQGYNQGYRQYAGYGGYYPRRNTGSILGDIFGRP